MKHFSLLLSLCLLTGMAHAATHTVRFTNPYDGSTSFTITDDGGGVYAPGATKYNIEEGITLTFSLSNNSDYSITLYDGKGNTQLATNVTSYPINADAPASLWFMVVEKTYTVTVWHSATYAGEVSMSMAGDAFFYAPDEEDPTTGMYRWELQKGANMDVRATAYSGYEFLYWKDNNSTEANRTITVNEDLNLYPYFGAPLKDNEADAYYTAMASLYEGRINAKLKGRTFAANMWNTLCLPFSLTQEQTEAVFGTGAVAQLVSATGDYTGLDIIVDLVTTGGIQAGQPYLVYPLTDIVEPVFENVQLTTFTNQAAVSSGASNIKLQGVLRPTQMTVDNKQTLFIGQNSTVYFPGVTANIKAYRAYFVINGGNMPDSAPAHPRFIVLGRDLPSDYIATQAENPQAGKQIENGRLVIRKNGHRYTAQGIRID